MDPRVSPSDSDLSHVLKIVHGDQAFSSRSVSLASLSAGALFTRITRATPAAKAYTTIQISRDTHVEPNSELRYVNHSCVPNLVFDVSKMEIRVARKEDGGDGKGVTEGDELTCFYPSFEWDMAQAFDCGCAAGDEWCIGSVRGAKWLDGEVLEKYWLNEHIKELIEEGTTANGENGARDIGSKEVNDGNV